MQTKTIVLNLGSAVGDPEVTSNLEFGKDSNCIDLENYRAESEIFIVQLQTGGRETEAIHIV